MMGSSTGLAPCTSLISDLKTRITTAAWFRVPRKLLQSIEARSGEPRVFARAQTRYSSLRLLAACGRRGCDAAPGDRGRRNAAQIDLRHRRIEEAQDGIGQLIVAAEAAAQPKAPNGHAAAGVQLEGRLTAIERRRDVVPGEL